ncbi:MAG: hypothetical protein H6R05_1078 [Burkholderiaceae bacterium]|nr:hypothetical protein [Burkholderiaceae bacterium]
MRNKVLLGMTLWLILTAPLASASTGVSCLIEARFENRVNIAAASKGKQLVNIAKVLAAHNDTQARNDFNDCATRFKKGVQVQFGSDAVLNQRRGTKIWLNYVYGDDRGGARWEHYTVIDKHTFKERQNGILR